MGLGERFLLLARGFDGEVRMGGREDARGPAPGRLGELPRAVEQGIVEIEDDAFHFFGHLSYPCDCFQHSALPPLNPIHSPVIRHGQTAENATYRIGDFGGIVADEIAHPALGGFGLKFLDEVRPRPRAHRVERFRIAIDENFAIPFVLLEQGLPRAAFGRLENPRVLHQHVIDGTRRPIFGKVAEDRFEVIRCAKAIGLPGLGDDVAHVDGFAPRAVYQGLLNVGNEEVGDHAGEQTARPNDHDIGVCDGLQSPARRADPILFQPHILSLTRANFDLSGFGIDRALERAVLAMEFVQKRGVRDEIGPLEGRLAGLSDHPFGVAVFAICQFRANIDIVRTRGENRALNVQHVARGLDGRVKIPELLRERGDQEVADVVVLKNAGRLLAVGKPVLKDAKKPLRDPLGIRERGEGVADVARGLHAQIPADAPGRRARVGHRDDRRRMMGIGPQPAQDRKSVV